MADHSAAIDFVLANEGGLSENPRDAGGVTNHGISLRFLRSIPPERYRVFTLFEPITPDTIRHLTIPQARLIYQFEFWLKAPFSSIKNQRIANYVFDCAVHHGIADGIKILQRATWDVMGQYRFIDDDGVMGRMTLGAMDVVGVEGLIHALPAERASHCRVEAIRRVENKEFLNGWLKRCYRI